MQNSIQIDYLQLQKRITELKTLQDECRSIKGSIYKMEGEGLTKDAVTELIKSSEEIIEVIDQYLINESILTLEKIKKGFEQKEESNIQQLKLLLNT